MVRDERRELENMQNDLRTRARDKKNQMEATKAELHNLESQEGQRFNQLRRADPDVAKAWEWLQENASKFEKPVFGPAMLTCSVKDKRYSNHVQSLLQKDDFLCFTAQTRNDHKILTDTFFRELRLAVSVRTVTADLASFSSKTPVARGNLQGMGLDGYALDFIEGPDPVLAMLCSEKRIHLTGVALKDVSEEQYQRLYDGGAINSFATGSTMYRITRRNEYGPGATSTMSRTIQIGQYWKDEPLDTAAKTELEQRLKECQKDFAELKQQNDELQERETTLAEKVNEMKETVVSSPSQFLEGRSANALHRHEWRQIKIHCRESSTSGNISLTKSVCARRVMMVNSLLT